MIFNQYSFVWLAVPVVALVGFTVWRMKRGPRWLRAAIVVVLFFTVVVVWLAGHPTATAEVNTLADAERLMGSGKPTVIEFFSEY
jgi:hypothetical protein